MNRCIAITDGNRISFAIQKGDVGYGEFAKVLSSIHNSGSKVWYGDMVNGNGVEQSGLVIAPNTPTLSYIFPHTSEYVEY